MKDNYSAWSFPFLECPADPSQEEVLRHLVSGGILAASTHNAQPWKFRICPRSRWIEVLVDPEYILPVSDPTGRQSYISVGCAAESIVLAAEAYGLASLVRYEEHAVTVMLHGGSDMERDVEILSAIKDRSMNRAPYLEREVGSPYKEMLIAKAADLGIVLDLVGNAADREAISDLQHEADKMAIGSLPFRNELGDYLLPNSTESGRGIVGKNFGLSDQMAEDIHRMMKSEKDLPPGMFQEFSLGGKRAMLKSPLLLVVSVDQEDKESLVKAGQLLQYAAVHAQVSGLSMAVLAALTEMAGFPERLATLFGNEARPVVVARVGYSAAGPMPKSPRVAAYHLIEVVA